MWNGQGRGLGLGMVLAALVNVAAADSEVTANPSSHDVRVFH